MTLAHDLKLAFRKSSTLSEEEKARVGSLSRRIGIVVTIIVLGLFAAMYMDLMSRNSPGLSGMRMKELVNGMALSIVTMCLVPWMLYGATKLLPAHQKMAVLASVISASVMFFGSLALLDVSLRLNTDLARINVALAAYSTIVSVSNVEAFPTDPAKCIRDAGAMISGLGDVVIEAEFSADPPKSCDRIFPDRAN